MNEQLKKVFRGKVVNKGLTINTGVDEFPRYVVEYLIDNYCTEENFKEDLHQVVRRLRENFVHGAEAEKIRHRIRETRSHAIIASLEIRLQETEDKYWGTISAINESFVNVSESLVRQYPMLLSGGMWGTIVLTYDETEVHNKKIRPFKVAEFTPFQISVIDLAEYIAKRREFRESEWLDILINSVGLNPGLMSRREKLLYMLRLVPLAEANFNCIELAPRETGKTYLYRNVSYYSHVLSGGKATPAGLFINNATGKVGIVGSRDAVIFDEIANTDFTDPKALVSIMQGYMQDAKFSRGKKEILAFASIVMVGNLDVQNKLPHEKYYHLFEPLPDFLQVEAFIDRIHCYTPGWEIPKIKPDSMSRDYGFITDYFAEIMHELRRVDVLGPLKDRYKMVDLSAAGTGITGRDVRGVEKTLSGLLKLMCPHGEINDEQLGELLSLAIEGRQRVRNQLHLMAPGEYGPIVLSAKLTQSGQTITPKLADANREQHVTLPDKPTVGEVIGLAVIGDDRGCILNFEVQALKGTGRIVSLGSMQRVMKESVAAAAKFIKTHASDVGLPNDWQNNFDIAVLATMMGIPKEGPSAGITIVTGIVSALTGRPVRNQIAMTGEITIMGKVLGIGGVLPKLQAAVDAGCTEVILPRENERDVQVVPDYIRNRIKILYASTIEDVLAASLVGAGKTGMP
ncbi:MAG: BREX system Lon protease-like protein BrxL [Planctomycetota bacterium]